MGMGTCRGCGAPIRWEKTAFGKAMPLDPEPVKVAIFKGAEDRRVVIVDGYTPHWATCPNADEFRKRGG